MAEEIKTQKEEETENIRDDLEYSKKSEFSKAKVCEDSVRKVQETRSQEMREGYNNYVTLPSGDVKRIYVPDTRKAFIGAIESLMGVLAPEIERSDRMQEKLEELKKKKDDLFKDYSTNKVVVRGMNIYLLDEKYIPKLDEEFPIQIFYGKAGRCATSQIKAEKGTYNHNVNSYWDGIVELYDSIFGEISILLSSPEVNYFKPSSSY